MSNRFKPGDHARVVGMPSHAPFRDGTSVEILPTSPWTVADGSWAVRPVGDTDLSRAGFVSDDQLLEALIRAT